MDGGTFTSDEVNFLIYRYMLENGFQHTAFTFGCESNIVNSTIDGTMVPRGALIAIIQKGLHFTEAEFFAALASTSTDTNDSRLYESNLGSMGLLEAVLPDTERMKLLEKKVIEELGEEACARMPPNLRIVEPPQPTSDISASSSQSSSDVESLDGMEDENEDGQIETPQPGPSSSAMEIKQTPMAVVPPTSHQTNNAGLTGTPNLSTCSLSNEPNGLSLAVSAAYGQPSITSSVPNHFYNTNGSTVGKIKPATTASANSKPGVNGTIARGDASSVPSLAQNKNGKLNSLVSGIDPDLEMDREKVITLSGHTASNHCMNSWCPVDDLDIVASGSVDGTAQIWHVPFDDRTKNAHVNSVILDHRKPGSQSDVTGIDWNGNGTFLATGCYDGGARVWNRNGVRVHEMTNLHNGPIFALKWSPNSTRILSAGVDNSTIVWNPLTNETKKFAFHTSTALDVEWIDDEMFASCSIDRSINVCQIGLNHPVKTYHGHEHEVNAIRYNRMSKLLASCSDDRSLKIWSLSQDLPVFNVLAHSKEIHAVRWAPTSSHIVATASFDHSHKIYNVETKSCTYLFNKHQEPVYSVAFSPDSHQIASGSFDGSVMIHDLRSGKLVLTYTGSNGVYEVDWNRRGDRLAAACNDGQIRLLDIRCLKSANVERLTPDYKP